MSSICDFHLCSACNRLSSSLVVKTACANAGPLTSFTECMPSWLNAVIASFEKKAITEAKRLVNRSSLLPDDASLVAAGETFIHMLTWPETRSRIAKVLERGFQKPEDFELRLGHHLGIE